MSTKNLICRRKGGNTVNKAKYAVMCELTQTDHKQYIAACHFITILVEELVDCHLLRVEEQGCHVIVCVVVAEEASYGWVHLLIYRPLQNKPLLH